MRVCIGNLVAFIQYSSVFSYAQGKREAELRHDYSITIKTVKWQLYCVNCKLHICCTYSLNLVGLKTFIKPYVY